MEHTIEQYLISLTNVSNSKFSFDLSPNDAPILSSIAKQAARGIALTDRQYELVKTKLVNYKHQFERNNMNNLDLALETLRRPLRSVDRDKKIYFEDGCLVVQFPFNAKVVKQLAVIAGKFKHFYIHQRGSNCHKFKLYEPAINEVINLFKNKEFEIDSEILAINDEIESILLRECDFVPYIDNQGLMNVNEAAQKIIVQELGQFDEKSAIKYWDRATRYGYKKTPRIFRESSRLAETIANRTTLKEYVDPEAYTLDNVATAIRELDRFPLLVTLNSNQEYTELKNLVQAFDFVDPQEQILLSRIEDRNNPNYPINSYIKEKNFNKWLDTNIKIVYIFKSSPPKLLFKGNWRPITHLSLKGEKEHKITASYIGDRCDLSIYFDQNRARYWDNLESRQLNQWV